MCFTMLDVFRYADVVRRFRQLLSLLINITPHAADIFTMSPRRTLAPSLRQLFSSILLIISHAGFR